MNMKHLQAYKRTWNTILPFALSLDLFFVFLEFSYEEWNQGIIFFLFLFISFLLVIILQFRRFLRLEKALLYDGIEAYEHVAAYTFEELKAYLSYRFVLLDFDTVVYALHPEHNAVLILYATDYIDEIIRTHQREIEAWIKQHHKKGAIFYSYVMYKDTLTKQEIDRCLWKTKGAHFLMFGYEQSSSSLYYLKNYPYTLNALANKEHTWIFHEVQSMFHISTTTNEALPTFSIQPYLIKLIVLMSVTLLILCILNI